MKVSKSIFVGRPVEAAFQHFTADFGRWWPLKEGFSMGGARAHEIFLECRVGGRFYERFSDGEECVIGRVTAYEPPSRVAFTWRQTGWDADTEVEVSFRAEGTGTRVALEHRGFEALSGPARKSSDSYDQGWERVLSRYAA